MAKNFREPEAKMSPGARARSDAKTQKRIEEMTPQKLSLGRGRYWGESVSELFGFGLEVLDL